MASRPVVSTVKICYLNHDTNSLTGAGRFYNALTLAIKKIFPGVSVEALTAENILYSNKFKLLLALPAIRRVLSRCDLIHALDGWPYGVIAAWANKTLKKPLIITAIGTGAVKPLYSWWRRPILKWAYRQADKVVAVSNNTKREILKFLPDLKIEVINHGVDAGKFEIKNPKSEANLKPYILSVGAWKPRKGFEYSIKAFEAIKNKYPDLKYVILSKVPKEIKNKDERIVFLENLREEEMIALYQNAELFALLPQDDNKDIEGFGLVFLEAAAAGLPVIATRDSSAEDAVSDGKNGIFVSPRDYKEAAAALEKILSDKNLRQKMSEESLKFSKKMSWERAALSYKALYETLL